MIKRMTTLMAVVALGLFMVPAAGMAEHHENPCNPCAAKKNPCNPCNPCAEKKNPCNPCNPCAKKNPCDGE